MKKMSAIIIIFITTLGFFNFLYKKISLNFLDIKGTVIDLEEIEFYHNSRRIKKVKLVSHNQTLRGNGCTGIDLSR